MPNQKIVEYVAQMRAAGVAREEIAQKLKEAGWPQELINEAFLGVAAPQNFGGIESPAAPAGLNPQFPKAVKKGSPAKLIAVSALAVVFGAALIAGAVWGYNYYFPSPEAVLAKMTQKMSEIKTAEYQGKANMEVSYEGGMGAAEKNAQKMDFTIDFDGKTDISNSKMQKSAINIKLNNEEYLKGDFDFNAVIIGELIYAKVFGTAQFFEFGQFNPYFDQWLEIDIKKIIGKLSEQNPQLAEYFKKNSAGAQLTPVQIANLNSLAKKSKILIFQKQLNDEIVNGAACRRYQAKIDKEGLKKYIRGMGDIMPGQMSQQQIGQMIDMINTADFSGYEIWIAKNDFSLRRLKGLMDYKYDYLSIISYSMKLGFDLNYTGINRAVEISAPADSKPIIDLFEESMGLARAKARDAKRQSDMRQMVTAQEMWFGDKDRYYTCNASGGDCKGKANNFPGTLGDYITYEIKDPSNTGSICGQDLIYCGLDNAKDNKNYCFYAKLEGGGFATASNDGNFKRTTAPANFAECAKAN